MSIEFAANLLIFLVSSVKSVFDLLVNPLLFKSNLKKVSALESAEKKRKRDDISNTMVFLILAIASGIALWKSSMDNSDEVLVLQQKVESIEKYLFPTDGGTGPSAAIKSAIDKIEKLEKSITWLSENKASKEDLDTAIEILAELKPELEKLNQRQHTRTMDAGQ